MLTMQAFSKNRDQALVKLQLKQLLATLPAQPVLSQKDSSSPMRSFLVSVLDDPKSDHENRVIAIRLLLRLGSAYESVEMIASAALYTLKHGIDVSKELETWCALPEVYTHSDCENTDSLEFEVPDLFQLTKKVEFGSDPSVSQMMLTYDAWALDEKHIYNYNESRGLTKALQGNDGIWESIVATNTDLTGLKGVSMVFVGDKLLVRHKGCTERPFVFYDRTTL